jgi:hypothetical protein
MPSLQVSKQTSKEIVGSSNTEYLHGLYQADTEPYTEFSKQLRRENAARTHRRSLGGSVIASLIDSSLMSHIKNIVAQSADTSLTLTRYADLVEKFSIFDAYLLRPSPQIYSDAKSSLRSNLIASISRDPVEDGLIHQGQELIREASTQYGSMVALGWIEEMLNETDDPYLLSSILRLAGRVAPLGSPKARQQLITKFISSNEPIVREAAVQCAETWKDPALKPVLKNHAEEIAWLRNYINDVIEDL